VDITAQWFRPQSTVNETLVAAASPKFRTQQALTPPVNLTGRLFPTGNPSPSPSPATSGPFPLNPVPTTAPLPAPVAASPSPAAAPAKGSDTALYGLLALIAIPIGVALVAAALCLRSGSPASDPLPIRAAPMLDPMPPSSRPLRQRRLGTWPSRGPQRTRTTPNPPPRVPTPTPSAQARTRDPVRSAP